MSTIFISYRRDDSKSITGRINKSLCDTFKKENVFFDTSSIDGGDQYLAKIQAEIAASKIQLVIIGPKWLTLTDKQGNRRIDNPEDLVRKEVEWALANENIAVIPVLVEGAAIPDKSDLPHSIKPLTELNVEKIFDEPDYDYSINKLISSIKHRLTRKSSPLPKSYFSSVPLRWVIFVALIILFSFVGWRLIPIIRRFVPNNPITTNKQKAPAIASLPGSHSSESLTNKSPKLSPKKANTVVTAKQKKADYLKTLGIIRDKFVDLRTTASQSYEYQDQYVKNAKSCEMLGRIYQNNVAMLQEINDLTGQINGASSSVKKEVRLQNELLTIKNYLTEWNRNFKQAYPSTSSMNGTGCEVTGEAGNLPQDFFDHLDEQILGLKMSMMFTK